MSGPCDRMRGVTLVEMALVLLILGVLTRAAITPLVTVQAHRNYRIADNQLQSIKDGLWAHVVAAGVLPCPLDPGSSSAVSVLRPDTELQEQADCQVAVGGVPARALGLAGAVDARGALLDPWSRPYQLAVSLASHAERGSVELADWTTVGEVSSIGIGDIRADLSVCDRAAGTRCPGTQVRANQLAFVLYSMGDDPSATGDQAENQDGDTVFTLQDRSIHADKPFDDQLVWGSAAETLYWMLRAGWLP